MPTFAYMTEYPLTHLSHMAFIRLLNHLGQCTIVEFCLDKDSVMYIGILGEGKNIPIRFPAFGCLIKSYFSILHSLTEELEINQDFWILIESQTFLPWQGCQNKLLREHPENMKCVFISLSPPQKKRKGQECTHSQSGAF